MNWSIAPLLPVWLTVLLAGAALAACLLHYRAARRRLPVMKSLAVSLLRLGAFWLVIFFTLNPSLTDVTSHRVTPIVAVVVDTSVSMGLPALAGKGSRLDEARAVLTDGPQGVISSLASMYDVRLYALGSQLRQISTADLSALKADSDGSNVAEALRNLSGRASCVVLMSDGTLVGRDSLTAGGPPVIALPSIPKGEYRDVIISAIRFPPVVFRDRATTVEVTVRSHGYEGVTVPVLLKDGNRLVTARNIRLGRATPEVSLSFPFTASEPGTHRLSVTVQPQVGENITENNSAEFSVKVSKDKVRMLMVSGSPSLSYRYMRLALKNDPSVDLLSFVILRTPSNVIDVPLNEQSLIPLPVDTVFGKELKEFDILLFDNLPLHLYLRHDHLEAVREFVLAGGALAMIGGPMLGDDERLASTPLADVLPVRLEKPDYRAGLQEPLHLTSAGGSHPLVSLSGDRGYNGRLWRDLASLDGINLVKPKASASVLLETAGSPAHPVLTVASYGKGRVLVLATDYSWKWAAGLASKGRDNGPYLRLIERIVRWLAKDPGLEPMTVRLPDKPGLAGDEIQVRLTTGEERTGKAPARPLFSVFGPDGVRIVSRLLPGEAKDEFFGTFVPPKRGTYRIMVKSAAAMAEETLTVGTIMDRLDGAPRPDVLNDVAATTGGKVVSGGRDLRDAVVMYAEKGRKSFVEKRERPLWSTYYALAVLIALLSAEWYLRRRWGLP